MSAPAGDAPTRPAIDGGTTLIGIVGDPIAQVRSPEVFNARLAALGRNAVLVPLRVPAESFETTVRGLMGVLNLAGLVVTYPHKERALALADRVLPVGRQVGAINALRRDADGAWTGDIFDGIGLVRAVEDNGHRLAGRRVLLIGAGGAGRAIATSLAEAGIAAIDIVDRNPDRARSLARSLSEFRPGCAARAIGAAEAAGYDLVINATPVGMAPGDGLAIPLDGLAAPTIVVDIVPKPDVTPLMAFARAAGCPTIGGGAMIRGQADAVIGFLGFH